MTPQRGPRRGVFYGWWIVAAGVASLLFAGGIGYYTFGAFFNPLLDAFGWSSAQLSAALTIATLVGLAAPLVGAWVDRYGARTVMAIGALVTGGAFALLGLASPDWGPLALWYFYALYLVMGLGMVCTLNVPVAAVVSHWFSARRGLAMGITVSGFGLGGLLMLPLASLLIALVGWQMTYHLLGLAIVAVLVPVALLVVRDRPQDLGLLPDGGPPGEGLDTDSVAAGPQWTLGAAMRTGTFWLIVGALGLAFIGTAALLVHTIPFLQSQGLSPQMAAAAMALTVGLSVPGRVVAGHIVDRVPIRAVVALSFLLQIVALGLLLAMGPMAMVWAFVVVFGLAMGGMFALEPLLVSRYFGLSSFGAIYGGLWVFVTIGFAAGAPLAGAIFDATASYRWAFVLFIAATAIAAVLIYLVKEPRYRGGQC